MVRVLLAQVAETPAGKPVGVPMPVAPVVLWVILVIAVFRQTVGAEEAAATVHCAKVIWQVSGSKNNIMLKYFKSIDFFSDNKNMIITERLILL
jgi:hypothetical protein